ncbi:MAG: cupin domain-containing protein [Gemmataceae bacterium]
MKQCAGLLVVLLCVPAFFTGHAGEKAPHGDGKGHVMVSPDDLKWGPAPPGLPAGALAAVLAGNPTKAEPFVIRAKLPDGYKVPLHYHPTDENVTVLKGTLVMTFEKAEGGSGHQSLPVGSFMRMPKGMRHAAAAKGETIIQVHGVGPFEITYVNPKDDPRKKD